MSNHPGRSITAAAPRRRGSVRLRRAVISRARLETVVVRVNAVMCFIFGAQAVPFTFQGQPAMNQIWAWTVGLALFGSLAAVAITGFLPRYALHAAGVFAIVYAAIIVSWPFAAHNIAHVQPMVPWPWYLCNLAMAAAALAFTQRIAVLYILGVATAYALVRLTPAGGGANLMRAVLDSGYTLILGIAILITIVLLRRATTEVDRAQTAATTRYAAAVRERETEEERLRVDTLLHDGVLATLRMAGTPRTALHPALAVTMARNAITDLTVSEHTPTDPERTASLADLRHKFETSIAELRIDVTLDSHGLDQHNVPAAVVDDLFAATMQALMNSIQHAGPGSITRTLTITWDQETLTITIQDNGQGFDPNLPTDRLGVRKSILERTTHAGGTAHIHSHPGHGHGHGHGTTITLTWPTTTNDH
jgi:signal transduction histidine kinase